MIRISICVTISAILALVLSQSYDTYSFYPLKFYLDNSNNYRTTGITIIDFSDDYLYMVVKGSFQYDILMVYYRGPSNYQFLYTVYQPDVSAIMVSQIHLSGSEPFVYLVMLNSDSKVRTFHLNRYEAVSKQVYTPLGGVATYILGSSYTNILTTTPTRTHVMQWNTATQIYTMKTDMLNGVAKNPLARAISPDGAYLIVDHGAGTTILYLYDTTSLAVPCSSYDFTPMLTSYIQKTYIYQEGTSYTVLVLYIGGGSVGVKRLAISSGGALSFLEESNPISATNLNGAYISKNGNYLTLYWTSPRTISFYQYDNSTYTYNLLFSKNNYPNLSPQNKAFHVSSDGSIFSVGFSGFGSGGHSVPVNSGYVHFKCTVPYCQHCEFMGACNSCNPGFVLNGLLCSCPSGQTLINSTCVSCTVALCISCDPVPTCLVCGNGYVLANNSCSCPVLKSVSLVSGLCVDCNVSECQRCDYHNTCSQYNFVSSPTTTTTPTPTTNITPTTPTTASEKTSDKYENLLIFLVVAVIVLLVGTIAGIAFLYSKMLSLFSHLEKKEDSTVNDGPHKEERFDKELKDLNETNYKIISHSSEVKIGDFIAEMAVEEELPPRNTKRRRLRKEREEQATEQIQVRPKPAETEQEKGNAGNGDVI